MKKAKRWIVSAGACLLALTSMSVSFGQIPTAPIPVQTNDGLPLLTEPAPMDVAPIDQPVLAPAEPADIVAPAVEYNAAPTPAQGAPVVQKPTQAAPAPTQAQAMPQQPCRQCSDPCQTCPSGAYYSSTPYYGHDTKPWWLNIRPVPYTPVERERHGMAPGRVVRDRYGRLVPIEPPFYTVRGPRDFYLDNPRPLGY